MSLAKLAKMARGTASLDEVLEIFSAMGIEMQINPVPHSTKQESFQRLFLTAQPEEAKVTSLEGSLKSGQKIFAILVIPG